MNLKILQSNLNGYISKKEDLSTLVADEQPDIICLNETKLVGTASVSIQGYIPIMNNRINRRTNRSFGGGTCVLIKDDIAYDKVRKFQIDHHEFITVNIYPDSTDMKKFFKLVCMYVPPNHVITKDIIHILSLTDNTIIVGDLNAKHSDWGSIKANNRGRLFKDIIEEDNLEFYKMPANYKGSKKNPKWDEVIQMILTTQRRFFNIDSIKSLYNIGSDHLPVTFSVNDPSSIKPTKNIKLYHRINKTETLNMINDLNIEKVFGTELVEEKTTHLFNTICQIGNNIPTKTIPSGNSGLSRDVRDKIKQRRKIQNLLRKHKNNVYYKSRLKTLNKEIRKGLQDSKDRNWNKIRSHLRKKDTSRKSWKIIKNILEGDETKATGHKTMFNELGEKIKDKQDIANAFKDRQETIFQPNPSLDRRHKYITEEWYKSHQFHRREHLPLYHHPPLVYNPRLTRYEIEEQVTEQEVKDILKNLKTHKSPGNDGIQNKLLFTIRDEISKPLANLYNDWLNNSIFPDQLKLAKIVMIPKKKNTNKIAEFRPISLLPTVGKVFEKLLANRIYKWAEDNDIINKEQSGFRKNRSTVDNLFSLVDDIIETFNNNKRIHGIFVDFEKAFDKVNHSLLLFKLKSLGLPTYILNILHSYLSNRKGYISFEQFKSEIFNLKAGVPQGSCLSPILYCLFVSDVPKPTGNVKLSLFADDLVAWEKYTNGNRKELQKYLNLVIQWCEKWGLKVNIEKTLHVTFRNSGLMNLFIYNTKVKKVDQVKFLGMLLDKSMRLIKHVDSKITNSYYLINFFNTLKTSYDIPTSKNIMLYKSLMRSTLEYGHIILLSLSQRQINRLEVHQNKALRMITGKPIWTRLVDLRNECKITSLHSRLQSLAKNWYLKAQTTPHHPVNTYAFENNPNNRHKTLLQIVQTL